MSSLALTIIQGIVVLSLAPLSVGVTRFCKARLQGRHGPSPFLPYSSLATLLKKENVVSSTASWIHGLAPLVVLGSSLFLALTLPLVVVGGLLSELSNFFVVAAVLTLGAVFLVLGGLDTGSAFGGMGGSREMTITALLEPVLVITLAGLVVVTGSASLDGIVTSFGQTPHIFLAHPFLLLSLLALVLLALAENARYPVDNPATHLELTMVHEAMILDYSGHALALLEYASGLKLTLFALLIANLAIPGSTMLLAVGDGLQGLAVAVVSTIIKLTVTMVGLALLESTIVKMRFFRVQEYLSGAFFLGFGGLVLALIFSL